MLAGGAVVVDTLDDQLRELVAAREPGRRFSPEELDAAVAEALGGAPAWAYGVWAFFPWSNRLVHLLPRDEFRALRGDRNRDKVTADEQARLREARIAVIGLSVGLSAATTLALEGVGGAFRLADFDTLSLSNLNRLRAGVADLGMHKGVLAARQLAEIDPWLDVEVLPEGATPENLDRLLDGVDLLVEECDDLQVKLLARERARARRIPVVMDTSDRGLLDVERFDREPDRPLLHGLMGDVDPTRLRDLPPAEKVPLVIRVLGGEAAMSPRMASSLAQVKRTLSSWPQLASGVTLGGALVADAARRILLGELTASGRWSVDLDRLVADGTATLREAGASETQAASAPKEEAAAPEAPPAKERRPVAGRPGVAADRDEVLALLPWAILAPSAHNAQPWRFRWRDGTLEGRLDRAHCFPFLDPEDRASLLALGAAAFDVELAARAAGLVPETRLAPDGDPDVAWAMTFRRGPTEGSPLLPLVAMRTTNRRRPPRQPLRDDDVGAMQRVAAEAGGALNVARDPAALDELAVLLGAGDRLSFLCRPSHSELLTGFRFTREEADRTRDGLDVDTLELAGADRAALKVLTKWENVNLLARVGAGRMLETMARNNVAASGAIATVTVAGTDRAAAVHGGRVLQRVWLEATARNVGVHPMAGLPYLIQRVERHGREGLTQGQATELASVATRLRAVLPEPEGHGHALLLRLFYGPPPTMRSLRRPVAGVVEEG